MCIRDRHHTADRKPGRSYLAVSTVRSIEEGGWTTPISPNLFSGGPAWTRGQLQSVSKHGRVLGARFPAPGDHFEPISDNFPRFGAVPPADTLTPCHCIFLVFQQLATGLCPLEPHRDSGFMGGIGLKRYPTVVEMRRFRGVWPRTCF